MAKAGGRLISFSFFLFIYLFFFLCGMFGVACNSGFDFFFC